MIRGGTYAHRSYGSGVPSAAAGWVCPARSSASHAPHAPFPSSADPPARSPPAAYGINGTSLPFQRHQWNIAAVCRGRQGGPEPPGARLAGRVRLTRHTAGPPQARTPHRPADPTASRRRAAAEANEICRGTSTSQELRRGPVIYSSEPHTEAVCKTAGFSKGHSEPRRGPHCRIWPCMRIKAPPRRGGAGPADAGPLPARV